MITHTINITINITHTKYGNPIWNLYNSYCDIIMLSSGYIRARAEQS